MKFRGAFGTYKNGKIEISKEKEKSDEVFDSLEESEKVVVISTKQFIKWLEDLEVSINNIEEYDKELMSLMFRIKK
ncbi:MAG: hypothetical protein Kow0019_15340 [Methanobacteriaceae archaeon]